MPFPLPFEVYGLIINEVSSFVNAIKRIFFVSSVLHKNATEFFTIWRVIPVDTVDRIFDLLDKTTMEQREFAALVGVSDDTASNWRRRKSGSYSKKLTEIAKVLDTTPEYLLTGITPDPVPDPELAAALSQFEKLTPEQRAKVIGYMEGLISSR